MHKELDTTNPLKGRSLNDSLMSFREILSMANDIEQHSLQVLSQMEDTPNPPTIEAKTEAPNSLVGEFDSVCEMMKDRLRSIGVNLSRIQGIVGYKD